MEVQTDPPSKLVAVVAPFVVEVDMLGAQSPTFMIQDVLGELASAEEVAEAPRAVEEEDDSSSTPGKEDVKNGKPPA